MRSVMFINHAVIAAPLIIDAMSVWKQAVYRQTKHRHMIKVISRRRSKHSYILCILLYVHTYVFYSICSCYTSMLLNMAESEVENFQPRER